MHFKLNRRAFFISICSCAVTPFRQVLAILAQTLPKGIITVDGRDAPPLVLNDINGDSVDLSQFRGKWVFAHFWASWCGPCRREMPTIQAIDSEFKDSGLVIVLINTAEDEDTVFDFLGTVAPDMNTLLDSDGLATEQWQPRGLPSTYFVDPEGKLRYIALGGRPWDKGRIPWLP